MANDGVGALRQRFRDDKAALMQRLAEQGSSTRGIRKALTGLSRLTDQVLRELWQRAGFKPTYALIAVGGYGRGELFPYSDVDVLVLMPDGMKPEQDEPLRARLETFIGWCWDVGLEIGSSVRTTEECLDEAAKDVTVQTSLLEARLLRGNRPLFNRLAHELALAMDPKAFYVANTAQLPPP